MNRTSKFLLILFVAIGIYQINFAQSDEGWAIEERCLPEPTTILPDGWSFEGTLILTSQYKIHTYRQEWETPRIIVQNTYPDIPNNGALSPDGKWFATVIGTRTQGQTLISWDSSAIQITDTNTAEKYIVDWDNSFTALHSLYGHGLYWLPDNKLLYSMGGGSGGREFWHVIDPFTNTSIPWEGDFPLPIQHFILSPNAQMRIYGGSEPEFRSDAFLYNGIEEIHLPTHPAYVFWHPNSTQFASVVVAEPRVPIRYSLFDLEGIEIAFLASIPEGIPARQFNNAWAHNGQYLLFHINRLYIADIESKMLIDPCIETPIGDVAWSSDNSKLAIVEDGKIQIIDFNLWERFTVGYHTGGGVIGWRADDE